MPAPTKAAFEQWVARVRPQLVRSATALLKDRDEAESVVQATLLKIWEGATEAEVNQLDAYAKRAVWLNALRWRQRRRDLLPLEASEVVERIEAGGLPDDLHPWQLERALLGLPPGQQAVIRLRFYGGYTFQEIGKALSISMNTAASRCRYGLNALRVAFAPERSSKGEEDE
jgi:RNA polymerase sigma factor (sigma-70 family)